jgi:hypothetical protein
MTIENPVTRHVARLLGGVLLAIGLLAAGVLWLDGHYAEGNGVACFGLTDSVATWWCWET